MWNKVIRLMPIAAVLVGVCAHAATIRVPADQPTIQAGIMAAVDGDTVLVTAGSYTENLDYLDKRIIVVSADGSAVTFLSPANLGLSTVVMGTASDDQTQLRGFTLTGGMAGQMVYIDGGTPVIRDNVLRDFPSPAQNAVAIHVASGNPLISRNIFYGIRGISCVGIFAGTARIINNTTEGNTCGFFTIAGAGIAKNNIVTRSTGYGIFGVWTELAYNDVYDNGTNYTGDAAPGTGSISLDPSFVNPIYHDYRLRFTSPCRDAGDPAPEYTDGDGTRNDIGAMSISQLLPVAENLRLPAGDWTHLTNHTPEFAWTYIDTLAAQQFYEFEVGTDADWTVAEAWDDGPIASDITVITYAGAPLIDGTSYHARVRVSNGVNWGDWSEISFRMNTPPTVPSLFSPEDGADLTSGGVELAVSNASDAEGDPRVYDFFVYVDAGLTDLAAVRTSIAEQSGTTKSGTISGLTDSTTYWWRARARDDYEASDWTSARTITISDPDTIYVPQDYQSIQAAINAAPDYTVISVAPGTYTEPFAYLGKKLKVISSGGPSVTLLRTPQSNATVDFGNNADTSCLLEGFDIMGVHAVVVSGGTPIIRNNVIHNCSYVAIAVFGGDPLITRNVFYLNDDISCIGINSGSAHIISNTFDSNHRGFYSSWGQGVARNNIVANSLEYGIYGFFPTVGYNDAWGNNPNYAGGASAGAGDISLDPLFADPELHDYRLMPGSPCLDAGHPDAEYNDPDGSRANIGALGLVDGLPLPMAVHVAGEDAQHVISATPEVCWHYADSSGSQVAYEIEVGSDSDWSTAELWAPGLVNGQDTCVMHAGLPLGDGQQWWLRIRLSNGTQWGNWRTARFRQNSPPAAPIPAIPHDGDTVRWDAVTLELNNSVDLEQDQVRYDFRVASDPEFTSIVAEFLNTSETPATTSTPILSSLIQGALYYWQCRAYDGFEYSEWTPPVSFRTRGIGSIYLPDGAASLQDAVDFSGDQDTIIVLPGTYLGGAVIRNKSITIRSRDGLGSATLGTSGDLFTLVNTGGADTVVIEGLVLYSNSGRGVASTRVNLRMRDCLITHAGGSVVHLSGALCELHSCQFYESGSHVSGAGVQIDNQGQLIMDRCIFYGLTYQETFFTTAGQVTITNNTVYGCSGGFNVAGWSAVPGMVINNIFANVAGTAVKSNASGPYIDYNLYYSNGTNVAGADSGTENVLADPLLTGPALHEFTPLPESPCIDAGHPSSLYDDPDGSRNDIGAIPTGSTCPCPCHADPYCNGQTDIIDIVTTIGIAFRNVTPMDDDEACLPYQGGVGGRTDVDCNGGTDVVDIVKMIDVAFRSRSAAEAFCDPCTLP